MWVSQGEQRLLQEGSPKLKNVTVCAVLKAATAGTLQLLGWDQGKYCFTSVSLMLGLVNTGVILYTASIFYIENSGGFSIQFSDPVFFNMSEKIWGWDGKVVISLIIMCDIGKNVISLACLPHSFSLFYSFLKTATEDFSQPAVTAACQLGNEQDNTFPLYRLWPHLVKLCSTFKRKVSCCIAHLFHVVSMFFFGNSNVFINCGGRHTQTVRWIWSFVSKRRKKKRNHRRWTKYFQSNTILTLRLESMMVW